MNDGSIVFSTALDNEQLEKQLNGLTKKISTMEDKIAQKRAERAPLAEQSSALAAQLDAAKARLEYMNSAQANFSGTAITQQEGTVSALQAKWNATQTQVERYDAAINRSTLELERNREKAGGVASELARAGRNSNAMSTAVARAQKNMDMFAMRIKSVIRSALVFVVITQALAKLRGWIADIVKVSPEANAAVGRLKAALLTLAQPLVSVVIPAFTALVNVLADVLTMIARVVSMIAGTSIEQSAASAEALNEETTALNGTGAAAKKAGKQLAAFDEINKIGGESDGGGSSSKGVSADFSGLKKMETQEYKDKIDELTTYASGALLALGVILAFSGVNILLGIGLMAVGAAGLAAEIKENWGASNEKVKGAINTVLVTLGAAGLVIGAILAFSGANILLGIGLMALGAASLGTAAALNWNAVKDALRGPIGIVVAVISTYLLAIGAMLAFSGVSLPLGIALMAAGAAGLVTVTALNWGAIKTALQGPVGAVVAAVSIALLALGAILAFSGVALPLGIALMAAGAIGLTTVTALNWNVITGFISDHITEILVIGGASLLALGLILALSGVGLPLGIALIAAGAASLVTATSLNWNAILDKLKGAWGSIKNWWNSSVVPALSSVVRWFADHVINPILAGVEGFINFFIRGINWIIDALNSIHISIPDWIPGIGGKSFGINIPRVSEVQLPRLATGAVIPPNREFLAVLGDQKSGPNVEAPLSMIEQALQNVMNRSGGGRPTTLIMECDRREFGRLVFDLNNDETQRVGVRFAK